MPSLPSDPTPRPRSLPAPLPPRRYNRTGLYLAIAVALACIPFTLKFQEKRVPHMENRQWQMLNLYGISGNEATKRYGTPVQTRDFSLENDGIFAGPKVGLKHFYRPGNPDYAAHLHDPVVWKYPDYSTIREMIWKLPDSYLTVWLHEPRAVIDLSGGDDSQILLPATTEGAWVALDNYRIGNDFFKTPPVFK